MNMKIEISAKEVLEFINGGDVPALKEKLSGALLAAANSPEMEEAIKKRLEDSVQKALDGAFKVEQRWGQTYLDGWAVSLVKDWVRAQLGNKSIGDIVRKETQEAVKETLPQITQQVVNSIAQVEIVKALADELTKQNIRSVVQDEVRAAVQRMFGAV
jgi:hypothetical protein